MDINSQECAYNITYYMGLYIIQLKLYGHGSNVSGKCLETLFWTSRLGLVSIPSPQRLGLVIPMSRTRLSLGTVHMSQLQPC